MNNIAQKKNISPLGGEGEKRITPDIVKASKANNTAGVKEALQDDPQCINSFDPYTRMTALHWSCANRNSEIYTLLVNTPGIELEPENVRGETPADLALQSGAMGIADDLHKRIHIQDHLFADPFEAGSNVSIFDRDPD